MKRILFLLLFATLVSLTIVGVAAAQDAGQSQEPDTGLVEVDLLTESAKIYADRYGVSLQEATRRLELQKVIGKLQTELIAEERGTFAGMWVEHEPEYRIVARFTEKNGEQIIRSYVGDGPLADAVETRSASATLEELRDLHARVSFLVDGLGIKTDSWTDVKSNSVKLRVIDLTRLEEALRRADIRLTDRVETIESEELARPEANIYAGLPTSTCTSGFSVTHSSGSQGVLTAAHCSNSQSYQSTNLPFQSELYERFWDVQWHTAPGFAARPWIQGNGGYGLVYGTRNRLNQVIGSLLLTDIEEESSAGERPLKQRF